jgi:hypothetical protein
MPPLSDDGTTAAKHPRTPVTGKHHRTLDAIFHHPVAHNLDWRDVIGLIGSIGEAQEGSNNDFTFKAGGQTLLIHKPHTKDLTSSEVTDIRHFLEKAGFSPGHPSEVLAHPVPSGPNLLIVVDHHGTKIFHVEGGAASEHTIRPYDPHHFLHHLVHKDQDREHGQRTPEEPAYYEQIADAVALGGKIVVVGHGAGKSNAADHLIAYLRAHHRETYERVVGELDADLSAVTDSQLLKLVASRYA